MGTARVPLGGEALTRDPGIPEGASKGNFMGDLVDYLRVVWAGKS